MERFQNQLDRIEDKLAQLYRIVEEFGQQLAVLERQVMYARESDPFPALAESEQQSVAANRGMDAVLEHKDILNDDREIGGTTQTHGQEVSPALQIRRLNAQLTAAYNRIAALEEQLLARRIHF